MARNVGKKRGAQPRPATGSTSSGKKSLVAFIGGTAFGLAVAGGVYLLDLLPTSMELRAHEQACADDGTAKPVAPVAQEDGESEKKPVTFQFYDMLTKQETAVPVAGKETTRPAGTPPPVPPVVVTPSLPNPAAPGAAPVAPATPAAANVAAQPTTTTSPATPASAPAQSAVAPAPVAVAATIPVKPSVAGARYALQAGSFATRAEADRRRGELLLSGHNVNVQQATTDKGDIRFRVMVGPFADEGAMKKAQQQLAGMKVDTFAVKAK
jgi:cell division protein FtsN